MLAAIIQKVGRFGHILRSLILCDVKTSAYELTKTLLLTVSVVGIPVEVCLRVLCLSL